MKLLGKFDWLVVFALVLLVVLTVTFNRRSAGTAEIYHDGTLVRTVDLRVDSIFTLGEGMKIRVNDGKISVIDSDCPDKVCVSQGEIDSGGIPIVCVPNRVVIIIPTGEPEVDVIVQ